MNKATSFPVLTSGRLILRQLTAQDDLAIFSLRSDDRVNQFIGRPKQARVEEAQAFIDEIIRNKGMYWAICIKGQDHLIGTICLWNFSDDKTSAEVGYELMPDFQGKGFVDEALKAVIVYCFEKIALQTLHADTHKDNERSKRLLERNRFTPAPDQEEAALDNLIKYKLPNA